MNDDTKLPAAEPASPDSVQTASGTSVVPPATPPSRGTSKKKLVLIFFAVLLLLAAGAVAWFFVIKKSDSDNKGNTSQSQTQNSDDFVPTQFLEVGSKVKYLNEAGELEDFASLDENETVVEVVTTDGKPDVRYVTIKKSETTGDTLTAYGSISQSGKKQLVEFPASINAYYGIVLSPDKTKLAVEKSDAEGLMQSILVFNLTDGSSKEAYEPKDPQSGYYSLIDWRDDKTVLLQKMTCRNCDGPPRAVLAALDVDTGVLNESYFVGDDSKFGYAEFVRSADDKSFYVAGGHYDLALMPNETPTDFYIVKVDKTNPSAKQLLEAKDPRHTTALVGVADNGLYLVEGSFIESTAKYPMYSSENGSFGTLSKIKFLNESTGAVSDIAFESNRLMENTRIERVVQLQTGVAILLQNFNYDATGNFKDYTWDLFKLGLTGEDAGKATNLLQETLSSDEQLRLWSRRP